VRELYADRPAEQFGPQQLAAVRQRMIDAGWVRASINLHVCRIRTVWRWGVSQGLVPVATLQMLCTLAGLRKGKSAARESQPKAPVSWRQLLAVLRRCRPMIGAMVRLQFLTGMRPGEVCALRPCDLDRSGDVWKYKVRDEAAKTGNEVYWLGPRAVAVLAPWLLRAGDSLAPVFARYSTASYRRHIARCCREAGVSTFGPHQLRHAHATRVEDLYGREAAQKRLNHTQIKTTSRYTRTADRLVQRIAREMG
jgi:integrase